MSMVVHLRNGRVEEIRDATTCSWNPKDPGSSAGHGSPRWLICRNRRGEIIATYEESDIKGFQPKPERSARRFSFPLFRRQPST
jgi:hypothetical protein